MDFVANQFFMKLFCTSDKYCLWISVSLMFNFERRKVDKKKQTYAKTEACKLYSRVFWIFLPNVVKIDPYNFEVYRFKVCAFFWDTVYIQSMKLNGLCALSEMSVARSTSIKLCFCTTGRRRGQKPWSEQLKICRNRPNSLSALAHSASKSSSSVLQKPARLGLYSH